MIDQLKSLLEEVTVHVTKTRGKMEITFSFEGKVEPEPIKEKIEEKPKEEPKPEPEEKVVQMSGTAKRTASTQAMLDDLIEQAEREEKQEHEEALEQDASKSLPEKIDEAIQSSDDVQELADKVTEVIEEDAKEKLEDPNFFAKKNEELRKLREHRINLLKNAGMVLDEATNKMNSRNGNLSIGTEEIYGLSDVDYKALVDKAYKESEKPTKSFSEFQAEQVQFKEEVFPDNLPEKPEPAAPAPAPIPQPIQVSKTTLEQDIEALKAKAVTAGYDPNTIDTKSATKESIAQLSKYIDDNPLK